jgi:hypothetical protein
VRCLLQLRDNAPWRSVQAHRPIGSLSVSRHPFRSMRGSVPAYVISCLSCGAGYWWCSLPIRTFYHRKDSLAMRSTRPVHSALRPSVDKGRRRLGEPPGSQTGGTAAGPAPVITSYYRPNLRAKTAGAKCAYSRVTMVLERAQRSFGTSHFLCRPCGAGFGGAWRRFVVGTCRDLSMNCLL